MSLSSQLENTPPLSNVPSQPSLSQTSSESPRSEALETVVLGPFRFVYDLYVAGREGSGQVLFSELVPLAVVALLLGTFPESGENATWTIRTHTGTYGLVLVTSSTTRVRFSNDNG